MSLVASRIVSMTFIPLLGYYLIRPPKQAEKPMAERRTHGFAGFYYRVGDFALGHRWAVFAVSLGILAAGWVLHVRGCTRSSSPRTCRISRTSTCGCLPDAPLAATERGRAEGRSA